MLCYRSPKIRQLLFDTDLLFPKSSQTIDGVFLVRLAAFADLFDELLHPLRSEHSLAKAKQN